MGQTDKDIVSVHISSGLSGTINSATQAAKQCPELNITLDRYQDVVGRGRLSGRGGGAGHPARLVAGADLKQRVQEVGDQTEIFFTLDTLYYLQKGGRIGRVQAMAGALLNLKPVITVDKGPGTYITVAKGRSMSKSITLIADQVHEKMKDRPAWVHVLHTNSPDQAQALAELIRRADAQAANITRGQIVPVLGVHTGPGCVGAVCGPLDVLDE